MPCLVFMKDMLEPIEVDEELPGMLNALNMASAKNMTFMVMDAPDGGHLLFNLANINFARDTES